MLTVLSFIYLVFYIENVSTTDVWTVINKQEMPDKKQMEINVISGSVLYFPAIRHCLRPLGLTVQYSSNPNSVKLDFPPKRTQPFGFHIPIVNPDLDFLKTSFFYLETP